MSSFESLYHETEMNVREAVYRFRELKSQCEAMRRENAELREEAAGLRRQLEDMAARLKLVELTNTITDKDDRTELKKQINDWVREIDNSIRLLNGR